MEFGKSNTREQEDWLQYLCHIGYCQWCIYARRDGRQYILMILNYPNAVLFILQFLITSCFNRNHSYKNNRYIRFLFFFFF